ncbi:MAG TPA: alpha/beta hydrolase [Gemmataceae bacterium]|nr:alpha/beta hydrolase [Gemmataceae bacterium]
MRQAIALCWALAVLLWLAGSAVLRCGLPSATAGPPRLRRGILFMIDGAGGFEASSRTIRQTAAEDKLPLEVRSVRWTHGYWRVISDQTHASHMQRAGRKLAEQLLLCREEAPEEPIFLMGHSAGCGVVLCAAENLPPNTLERIVLLAPAVSSKHDLRAALRSSCLGIDAFTSSRDWGCLGLGILVAGTTDRSRLNGAAGKNGFQPIRSCSADEVLYTKLRQYPWDPSLSWTGHKGGHYGSYQPGFLRAFVFPLFISSLALHESGR